MRTGVLGQINNYFRFLLNSKPRGGHRIHSPYVYKLYTEVIEPDRKETVFDKIEEYRKELRNSGLSVIRKSIGEGVNNGYRGEETTLKRIASTVSIPVHLGRLLYRLCKHYQPQQIIELGTSVGISTMYLAANNPESTVYTIEGDETILNIAQTRFRQLGFNNIKTVAGNFDDRLPALLQDIKTFDMAFIDGNHNSKALICYVNQLMSIAKDSSIIIVDDIRWSKDMEKAWKYITTDPKVTISIDLFRCGILIFEKGITKQHFLLGYSPY